MEVIRLRIQIQEFFKNFSTLRDSAFFHNLAYISGESVQIFMKMEVEVSHQWTPSHYEISFSGHISAVDRNVSTWVEIGAAGAVEWSKSKKVDDTQIGNG